MIDTAKYSKYFAKYFWKDTATVSRSGKDYDDIGAVTYGDRVICEGVPCHLAMQSMNALTATDTPRALITATELVLCLSPEYDIVAGDMVTVTTYTGQRYELFAADAFKYGTHQEVRLTKEGDANGISL
ncbi:hypothetical protein [Veillonella magna]|uniref:Uncharacterized protein n=1 Tax=Veillonella magna TaxID=464322 RepID=A0ABS2GI85_9FIRM|nr:hypothetical protein [Veillonella magna]MBM6824793.1 hypothetical protein [Veillonella magna]MBM6913128.1 hypothetical protein [Veillonella magna]